MRKMTAKQARKVRDMLLLGGIIIMLPSFVACSGKLVEGSEKTYYGTVADSAMSVVNEGDRQGRTYITISTDEGNICF